MPKLLFAIATLMVQGTEASEIRCSDLNFRDALEAAAVSTLSPRGTNQPRHFFSTVILLPSGRNKHTRSRMEQDKLEPAGLYPPGWWNQRQSFCLLCGDRSMWDTNRPKCVYMSNKLYTQLSLLSKHSVGSNKMFLSTLCYTMCIQVTGGWWMGKNSRTALQQALTSVANYLNRGVVRGNEGSDTNSWFEATRESGQWKVQSESS